MKKAITQGTTSCGLLAIQNITKEDYKPLKNWFNRHTKYKHNTNGTDWDELREYMAAEGHTFSTPEDDSCINDLLTQGKPFIVGVHSKSGGHWMAFNGWRMKDCNYNDSLFWDLHEKYEHKYSISVPVVMDVPLWEIARNKILFHINVGICSTGKALGSVFSLKTLKRELAT